MNFEEFDERLEQYLRNEMSASEEQAFKGELEQNEEMKERAAVTALMIKSMQERREKEQVLVNEIAKMNEDEFAELCGIPPHKRLKINKKKPLVLRQVIRYAMAACIVLLIAYVPIMRYYMAGQLSDWSKGYETTARGAEMVNYEHMDQAENYEYLDQVEIELAIKKLKQGKKSEALKHLENVKARNAEYPDYVAEIDEMIEKIRRHIIL